MEIAPNFSTPVGSTDEALQQICESLFKKNANQNREVSNSEKHFINEIFIYCNASFLEGFFEKNSELKQYVEYSSFQNSIQSLSHNNDQLGKTKIMFPHIIKINEKDEANNPYVLYSILHLNLDSLKYLFKIGLDPALKTVTNNNMLHILNTRSYAPIIRDIQSKTALCIKKKVGLFDRNNEGEFPVAYKGQTTLRLAISMFSLISPFISVNSNIIEQIECWYCKLSL